MIYSFDYHGVITVKPDLIRVLSEIITKSGSHVHIVTGSRVTNELRIQLNDYLISYHHIFSIADYHHVIGTPMTGYEKGEPQIDEEIWNRTKGNYCFSIGSALHVDDSEIYGKYFRTPYALFRGSKPLFKVL